MPSLGEGNKEKERERERERVDSAMRETETWEGEREIIREQSEVKLQSCGISKALYAIFRIKSDKHTKSR